MWCGGEGGTRGLPKLRPERSPMLELSRRRKWMPPALSHELVAEIFSIALDVGLHASAYSHNLCLCSAGLPRCLHRRPVIDGWQLAGESFRANFCELRW